MFLLLLHDKYLSNVNLTFEEFYYNFLYSLDFTPFEEDRLTHHSDKKELYLAAYR